MSRTLSAAAMLLALTAGALAQDPQEKPTQDKPAAKPAPAASTRPAQVQPGTMISANSLRGMELTLEAEATPPKKEDAPTGREPAATAKAKVEDVIFSTNDGRLSYAVVTVPGTAAGREKIVLVPGASLKLAAMDDKVSGSIKMNAAQVQALSPFDLEKARKDGVDVALGEKPTAPVAPADPAGKLEDPAAKPAGEGPRFALTSQLPTWGLHASDQPFGRVKDAAIDTGRNAVTYLIAAPLGSGKTIVVPFAACTCNKTDKEAVLKVSKTMEQLSTAPTYEKPAKGFLTPDQTQRAEEFFGTRGPAGSQG